MQQPSTTLQRYRAQQQATPCTCGRYALYVVELLSNLRSVTHHIYLLELCSSYMLHVFARTTWFRTSQALLKFRQYYYCCMG